MTPKNREGGGVKTDPSKLDIIYVHSPNIIERGGGSTPNKQVLSRLRKFCGYASGHPCAGI